MDKNKYLGYYDNIKRKEEVVKMVAIPQHRAVEPNTPLKQPDNKTSKNKRKTAIEISESIGVYGAFGRTLSDLHKHGK